jgi:hypothetical protein
MSTITILQPNEQKKLYTDFLFYSGNAIKKISMPLQEASYQQNSTNAANSFFTQNFSWEYFSNELEFE